MSSNFLNEKELVLVKALIKYGPQKVNTLSRLVNIPRSSLYDDLEKMRKRGLVSCVVKNKTKTYRVCPLADMQNKLETEAMDLIDKLVFMKKFLPRLYESSSNKDDLFFTVIEGEDDIINAYKETLITENITIKTFVNLNIFKGQVYNFIIKDLVRNRIENNIKVKAILSPDSVNAEMLTIGTEENLIQHQMLDIPFDFNFHISLFKDVAYIYLYNDRRPLFIKTNYREVFDFLSDLHDELWNPI